MEKRRKVFFINLFCFLSQIFVVSPAIKPLSAKVKSDIVSCLQQGKFVEKVAAEFGVGQSSVSRIKNIALPRPPNLKPGRKKILSPTDEHSILRAISSGRLDTASQVQKDLINNLRINFNQKIVRRSLKSHELKAAVKKRKPWLTKHHIRQRLEFAERTQHWTLDGWKRVVWSDKTNINRLGSDGRK